MQLNKPGIESCLNHNNSYLAGMKRYNSLLFLLFILPACSGNKKKLKAETDIDAARSFIRAALDGKFNEARVYMLSDSVNNNWMDITERSYQKADRDTKVGYAGASINIHEVKPANDSTTIVVYSNSFKNDHDTLKVVRQNEKWLIDLKYLFQHEEEIPEPTTTDSLSK